MTPEATSQNKTPMKTAPMKDRHPILGWIIRLYMTLTTTFIAWVGAESLTAAALLVLLGAVLDIVRYRTVPELRMSEEELADRMERAAQDEALRKLYKRRYLLLSEIPLALIFSYTLLMIAADVWLSEATLRSYLRLYEWLHEIGAGIVANARVHPAELATRGYEFRALFVAHIYSVDLVFILLLAYLGSTRWLVDHFYCSAARHQLRQNGYWYVDGKKRLRPFWIGVIGLIFSTGGYAFLTKWKSIDWEPGVTRYPWDLHVSDAPLGFYTFGLLGIVMIHWTLLVWLTQQRVASVLHNKNSPNNHLNQIS